MPEKGHNMLHFPLSGYLHLHYAMFCVKYDFKNEVKHTLRGVATFGSNYIYKKKFKKIWLEKLGLTNLERGGHFWVRLEEGAHQNNPFNQGCVLKNYFLFEKRKNNKHQVYAA